MVDVHQQAAHVGGQHADQARAILEGFRRAAEASRLAGDEAGAEALQPTIWFMEIVAEEMELDATCCSAERRDD